MKQEIINALRENRKTELKMITTAPPQKKRGRPKKIVNTSQLPEVDVIENEPVVITTARQIAEGGGRLIRLLDYQTIIIKNFGEETYKTLCGITAKFLDCRCCQQTLPADMFYTQLTAPNRMCKGPYCKVCRAFINANVNRGITANKSVIMLQKQVQDGTWGGTK